MQVLANTITSTCSAQHILLEITCSYIKYTCNVTQNHWVCGFIHRPEFLNPTKNTSFRKLDVFRSSGDGKKTPTLLGPLERTNLQVQ
jgi:hypothetical protein